MSADVAPASGLLETTRRLLIASRPVSWINTAFPFAAAYLVTTGRVDAAFVIGTVFFLVPVQPGHVRHQRRVRLRLRPREPPQGRRSRVPCSTVACTA